MDESVPFLPYGHQSIDDDDIQAVVEVLRSDWLTCGPAVERFETDVCKYTGARHGVAVSSGTAALHAAMHALEIQPGDEVIVPPMTFAATVNCILYMGGTPVFADIDPETLLIDPAIVEACVTPRTKAIIGVDYAGQPCDWDRLREIADRHSLALVADSCHALGGEYKGRKVGNLADISILSFHPVKNITTGEGGMALANQEYLARRMRLFRNHGISSTANDREKAGQWQYEMIELGYNYRITDFQCALGSAQLIRLDSWVAKRARLAARYKKILAGTDVRPLKENSGLRHAWHLYVVRMADRDRAFSLLRSSGIGVNVHYIPVHLHPYYQRKGYKKGLCPVAEQAYSEILTLPLWPGMSEGNVDFVAKTLINLRALPK